MDRKEFEKRYTSARRDAIGLDFAHLNDVQREAAMTTQGPLLLLAGAGSGKTTVLINKIANILRYGGGSDSEYIPDHLTADDLDLLESYIKDPSAESREQIHRLCALEPVEPWRVIAITFTNKAAGELKERLEKMLGSESRDVWAMTFHSACVRILRRDIDKLGYDRSFTIYDTADSASLIKRILKDLDLDEKSFPYRSVLGYISRAKDDLVSPDAFLEAAEKSGDLRKKIIGRAYLEYAKRMKAANAVDFDDLIMLTVRLFNEVPDVLAYYQRRFKYVLIDEYQDTNNLQYLLASALAGEHNNICVVGDDDQSIYKFRGATIENILSFEQKYKDARVIRLEQNYRSTRAILDAANDVICNNKGRKGKKLWTENESGEKPELHIVADERAEAQFVADTLFTGRSAGQKWQDHTVLYRMNAQSNQLETAFKRAGIPYRIIGGTGFYDRAEIKDMLSYLCLLHNPNDDLRLIRVINNPPRGIGQTTIGKVMDIAAETGRPAFEIVRDAVEFDGLLKAAGKLRQFANMIDDLRKLAETAPLDELYDVLVEKSGYIRMLEEKATDENRTRIENVKELKTNIIGFINENGGSLFDFLSETALYTDLDSDDGGDDKVLMMTMHSAKGLEFDAVFIVGMEEGIFPGVRAIGDQDEMEEERRLCYVAMTRARKRLIFTSAKRRMIFGKTTAGLPSRFIREISTDNIEVHEEYSVAFDFDVGFSSGGSSYTRSEREISEKRYQATTAAPPVSEEVLADYKKGDAVSHKAFGNGVIIGLSPAGGDALVEIAFDDAGTKRLMLKSAAKYMTKR